MKFITVSVGLLVVCWSQQCVYHPETFYEEICVNSNLSRPCPCVTLNALSGSMHKLCIKVSFKHLDMKCVDWRSNEANIIDENTRGNQSLCLHPNQVAESTSTMWISCYTDHNDCHPVVIYLKGSSYFCMYSEIFIMTTTQVPNQMRSYNVPTQCHL